MVARSPDLRQGSPRWSRRCIACRPQASWLRRSERTATVELGCELHETARACGSRPDPNRAAPVRLAAGRFGVLDHGADLRRNSVGRRTWPGLSDPTDRPRSQEWRTCSRSTPSTRLAAAHAKLIGASTRDQPFGSLSSGDRAKLAWSRTSPRNQAAFANEFLSEWLGAGPAVSRDVDRRAYASTRGRHRMSGVRVPLAVDAQVRVPFGPILVPLRALVLLITAPRSHSPA